MAPIQPISTGGISGIGNPIPNPGQKGQPGGFQQALEGAIGSVEGLRGAANQSIERFLAGEGEDLHSTILATQRADLAFEMFMQVRNKVVQAYQEVMRMQM